SIGRRSQLTRASGRSGCWRRAAARLRRAAIRYNIILSVSGYSDCPRAEARASRESTGEGIQSMDFNYTPEDQAFRTEVRTWLEANKKYAPPPANMMAEEGAGDWEARVRWHKKLNEGGWVAVNWPKEYGGRGATVMQRLIYWEELN